MKKGDIIAIINENTGETIKATVVFKHHYLDTRSMLEAEGVENVLSGGGTIEDGINSYNSLTGYKENLPIYGIFAIGVKPQK